MRHIMTIGVAAALALGLVAYSSEAGQRKGGAGTGDQVQKVEQQRDLEQERLRSRNETRDTARLRDDQIYGHELMTREELNQYREQLRKLRTAKAQDQFRMQHEEKMRERALQQNKDIVPPGQGPIYRGDLMSVQERNAYREQLRIIESEEERARFIARHQERMDERAEAIERETEEAE